jgi:PAS domain S-box-containing protein
MSVPLKHMELIAPESIEQPDWLGELSQMVPVGIVVINTRGVITWVNNELQRQFGYQSSELIGRPVELLLPERFQTHHVDLRHGYASNPVARAMGSGRDLFGRRKDGSEMPVEIGLRKLDTRKGSMFVGTIVDMTARREAEHRFQRVIEAAPCGMLMVDQDQRIILVNGHLLQLFGYAREEILHQPLQQLLPARYRMHHGAHASQYYRNPTMRSMGPNLDLTALRKDGTEFSVEIGLSPVQMETGQCILATILDVTARKEAEQQLKRANADLEEFNYIAAHDLRSPLRGIGDLAHWIEEDLGDGVSPEIKLHVERMLARVGRMEVLIENLLEYARAGIKDNDFETVNVREWLAEERELLVVPQHICINIHSDLKHIRILKTPLSTVIRNLVSNAIKYNDKEKGLVEIEIRALDNYVGIMVRDNGPGIPVTSRERVFKLFQRLSSEKEGSGIGLSIVKRIVETHGGAISIVNRDDGKPGTEFLVKWPVAPAED